MTGKHAGAPHRRTTPLFDLRSLGLNPSHDSPCPCHLAHWGTACRPGGSKGRFRCWLRFQRWPAYLASSSSKLRAASGTATLPFKISRRVTLEPYMALSPLLSACTTAPSKLIPAKAPLL